MRIEEAVCTNAPERTDSYRNEDNEWNDLGGKPMKTYMANPTKIEKKMVCS